MSPFQRRVFFFLPEFLFLFALISSVSADYYIDDTNTSLTYSSGPKAAWAPYAVGGETLELLLPNGTYQVIDAFVCWNHTYRYAACFDTDTCLLTVPFTGSGVTVYVYQAGPVGINASITIDGTYAHTNVLTAPPAPAYEISNVSMFDVQQIPSGRHTLTLLINDLSGSYSGMMFDYVYVNESSVANSSLIPTTSAISTTTGTATSTTLAIWTTSTATSTTTTTSGSHTDIAAIIGGTIGAVAVIVAGALVFLWMRRRRGGMIDLHSGNNPTPFSPYAAHDSPFPSTAGTYEPSAGYNSPGSSMRGNDPTLSRRIEFSSFIPLVPNRLASGPVPFTAPSSDSSGSQSRKIRLMLSNETADTSTTGFPPSDSRQDMSPLLTDEQADFINSLHRNNVPAAAIARVVERMLVDQYAGIREWERETSLAWSNTMTTAPPSYDLAVERRGN